ncbi:MAG: spore coat protein U domain-containing protein [Syntrophorhabdaceae bacterium]
MKNLLVGLVVIGFMVMASVGFADTTSVNVSATVSQTCKFTTTGTAVAFTLDPSATGPASGVVTTPPQFWCTKGMTFNVTDNNGTNFSGSRRMKHATLTEYIPYSFAYSPTTGTGAGKNGAAQTIIITSAVALADFQDASAGSYSDTVVITVAP